MFRIALLVITLGSATIIGQQSDQTGKQKSDQSSSRTSSEQKAQESKLTHDQQIEAMFKDHPFIDNPRGELRRSKEFNPLKGLEASILNNKATERAFTGEYWDHKGKGTYICRKCNCPLYRSSDKFDSQCGWPSFDDEIRGTVTRVPDRDGMRIEIVCTNCGGHLGHVFMGERFTLKNTRHCVNSKSILFVEADDPLPTIILSEEAKRMAEKNKGKAKSAESSAKPSPGSKGGQSDGSDQSSGSGQGY